MIHRAKKEEFDDVRRFYYDLIDDIAACSYKPQWQKNVYPSDDDIKKMVEHGEMYVFTNGVKIIGAMCVNSAVPDGYDNVGWGIDACDDEICAIHLLAVSIKHQRTGIAGKMVNFAIEEAKQSGKRSIRLDVLSDNIPALKLYESLGFKNVGTVCLYYEDTGLADFVLFEYLL